jgi:hypothetical protein
VRKDLDFGKDRSDRGGAMSCYMRETYEKEYERLPRFRDKDGFIQFRHDYVLYVERENERLLNEIEKLGVVIAELTNHQTKE